MNPTPNPILVNTGEEEKVSKTIDDFFIETKEFVTSRYNLQRQKFEIKSGELSYDNFTITNDRITYLIYENLILASVFQTRTEFNHIHYTFFRDLKGFCSNKIRI